jgi:hypothetical protein
MLWVLIGVALLLIWIVTLVDVLARKDLHGWHKALWALFVIFLPIIGVPAYFITKPPDNPHPFMSGGAGSDEEQLRARHPF